jgi:Nucleotide modification associated domain 2
MDCPGLDRSLAALAATDSDPRVYSYVVRHDFGFAPNPFHGWCTLATCKPQIRCTTRLGDWLIGTGSAERGRAGRLVFAMQVDERLTFESYWNDPRFQDKKPDLRGSLRYRYGDNIYHRGRGRRWVQSDSRHSLANGKANPDHIARDTSCDCVLVSQHFAYFGAAGPFIPKRFRDWHGVDLCLSGRGYQWRKLPPRLRQSAIRWFESLDYGYQGDPADW